MHHAAHAYASTARSGLSGRELEAAVLSRCAVALQRACDGLSDDPLPFLEALERNRQCWHLIAREARQDDCHLPADVRRNLLITATFVFQRTSELCDAPTAEGAQALVTLNRQLAEGLEGRAA